jgi:hypothetical protein
MKTLLLLYLLLATMAASVSAQSFTAPARGQQIQQRRKAPPPRVLRRDVRGVIPRAIRGGNPLQMINPRAPARYGVAEESVVLEPHYYVVKTGIETPNYPGKWHGIKFFTFLF